MKNSTQMVLVVARENSDLAYLSSTQSPISISCGSIGRTIASKVLEGNGKALVLASDIKMAIDTIDGLNAIQDNFELRDNPSLEPLLYHLLKNM